MICNILAFCHCSLQLMVGVVVQVLYYIILSDTNDIVVDVYCTITNWSRFGGGVSL